MKRKYIALAALLLSSLTYSCTKNALQIIDAPVVPSETAQIKYFNFGVNSPAVNFYANGGKVSAISSATGLESISGTTSGGVYPASNYSLLGAGAYTFKAQISSTAAADANLAIASLAGTVELNKYYSLYTCGIYTTAAKTTDAFMVEDVLPAADYTVAYVRFVNTVSNGTTAMNLYARVVSTTTDIPVATAVPYKSASAFVAIPPGIYEFYARYQTTPTVNLISRTAATNGTVGLVGGKVYTIGSRGDITVTSTTATNRPLLDNTANR